MRWELHRRGRLPTDVLERSWVIDSAISRDDWPQWVRDAAATGSVPAVRDAEDITVVVVGGVTSPSLSMPTAPPGAFPPAVSRGRFTGLRHRRHRWIEALECGGTPSAPVTLSEAKGLRHAGDDSVADSEAMARHVPQN